MRIESALSTQLFFSVSLKLSYYAAHLMASAASACKAAAAPAPHAKSEVTCKYCRLGRNAMENAIPVSGNCKSQLQLTQTAQGSLQGQIQQLRQTKSAASDTMVLQHLLLLEVKKVFLVFLLLCHKAC